MTANIRTILIVISVIFLLGAGQCNSTPSVPDPIPSQGPTNGPVLPVVSGPNVLTLTVNGTLCSKDSYINKPCVSITLCGREENLPCQTITDILLDTGSYGLRVFKSVIEGSISQGFKPVLAANGQTISECAQFGDGSALWGPVQEARVVLGGEPAVVLPIQIIDSSFSHSQTYCAGASEKPSEVGFNGILGLGFFSSDCGSRCEQQAANQLYYACTSESCSGTTMAQKNQVQNPVALLPRDNNGVIIEFPSVPLGGASSVEGYVLLGIGTQANNMPSGNVKAYLADPIKGEISNIFDGKTLVSYIDTGTNAFLFPNPSTNPLTDCSQIDVSYKGWYCPSSIQHLVATYVDFSGNAKVNIPFDIGHFLDLQKSGHFVYQEIGATLGTDDVIWGLPFFFGRNVYIGMEGKASSLGTGPYWGF